MKGQEIDANRLITAQEARLFERYESPGAFSGSLVFRQLREEFNRKKRYAFTNDLKKTYFSYFDKGKEYTCDDALYHLCSIIRSCAIHGERKFEFSVLDSDSAKAYKEVFEGLMFDVECKKYDHSDLVKVTISW